MYNILCFMCTLHFYFSVSYSVLTTKTSVSICHHTVDPFYPFCPPPCLFPSGNHYSVLCIYNFIFYLFINLLIYLFLSALGLHCCAWVFSCGERGLLIAVVSLVAKHGL